MAEPKVRFKQDNGETFPEWCDVRFGDVFTEVIRKTSDTKTYPLFSLTIEKGVTAKTDRYERSFLVKKDEDNYKIVPPNAFVYNPMNLRFGALAPSHEDKEVSVSQYYNVFTLNDERTLAFWENYLVTDAMLQYYFSIATGSLIEKLRVHYSAFVNIVKQIPCIEEQCKIADFLSSIDEVISTSEEEIENLEKQKKAVMKKIFSQEVRFKRADGSGFPDWKECTVSDCLAYEQPGKYIVHSDEYDDSFNTPVLTANKGFILGYTNETDGHYTKGDVIIYDDFTMDMKYVSFEFKVKSSAIKMLTPRRDDIDLYFMYGLLLSKDLHQETHTRSYISLVEPMSIDVPCLEEQRLIADFLSDFDEAIAAAKRELELWKELKKGLLQQMFV